ncbi:MAG: UDP-N-acetylglucosamine 1-carboxyvinyltransferase [Alphaproteobacteria bacterium]|nr:UDP-N-acetylglucosamine 1-carboxyvinyltransferase [Alphaproteobacteria bacterium]NDC56321.1 UDP-N-acetylglucosamine 1-carboxyvinyltransferase [Alphaproteobacteria bacterium]
MDKLRIVGGAPLRGTIAVGGAKNAALPLMTAALLTDETLTLANMPDVADITAMAGLLHLLGVHLNLQGDAGANDDTHVVDFTAKNIASTTAPYDLVRKMRASILVLGPLLARAGEARVSLPGGCAIGTRPVDLHLEALKKLGAEIDIESGYVLARAPKGLVGGDIVFPVVTVTGTENALMAACLAKGRTTIANAAREPEVTDLAQCLVKMGADIQGIGTDKLLIQGKPRLHGAKHSIVPDRIQAGTYLMAVGMAGGSIEVKGAKPPHLQAALDVLQACGMQFEPTIEGLRATCTGRLKAADVDTAPFPLFPTDLQAQFMALMTLADGTSHIAENIFENRFMHVQELIRLGADIAVKGHTARVCGVPKLTGAPVMATDLRASVSLVMAGLAAQGETTVSRIYHLDRGYERLEEKLARCGAHIERVRG